MKKGFTSSCKSAFSLFAKPFAFFFARAIAMAEKWRPARTTTARFFRCLESSRLTALQARADRPSLPASARFRLEKKVNRPYALCTLAGFTLAELLIVLAIAGVVASVLLPIIKGYSTNNNKVLYKAAYNMVETVLSELTGNAMTYPNGNLDNTDGGAFFCHNFANVINIVGTINCACTTPSGNPYSENPCFQTTNGMRWWGFQNGFTGGYAQIFVDVNGSKDPNDASTFDDTDVLRINILSSGRIVIPSTYATETEYLSSP